MSKALTAKTGDLLTTPFKGLTVAAQQISEVLKANTGPGGLTPFDLDRVKIPAGGGLAWEVPSLEGLQNVTTLEGIVVYWKDMRSYWNGPFTGENQPPACSSTDGMVGIGVPGGVCLKCPLAQFGSAQANGKPSRGQACKQIRMLFLLQRETLLPLIIPLPPSSLKGAKQYFLRLASSGLPYYGVITQARLIKAKNSDGIQYSQAEFAYVEALAPETLERAAMMAQTLKSVFDSATVLEADVRHTE